MTDLEITRLCAEAMKVRFSIGWPVTDSKGKETGAVCYPENIYGIGLSDENIAAHLEYGTKYRPLEPDPVGDAQAMALVKKLRLSVVWTNSRFDGWLVRGWYEGKTGALLEEVDSDSLNRAICECVAKMQEAK